MIESTLLAGLHLIGAEALGDEGEVLLLFGHQRGEVDDYSGLILVPSLNGELKQGQICIARAEDGT